MPDPKPIVPQPLDPNRQPDPAQPAEQPAEQPAAPAGIDQAAPAKAPVA